MKNYLDDTREILGKGSYLGLLKEAFARDVYSMALDEEIDIFSELPLELFVENKRKQEQKLSQMSNVMRTFKKEYTRYVTSKEMSSILPKLKYYIDEEGASVIQLSSVWNEGNASLYFAFEENTDESSFGMVWNDSRKKNFESRSGSIDMNDIDDIIHEVLEFLFRVY